MGCVDVVFFWLHSLKVSETMLSLVFPVFNRINMIWSYIIWLIWNREGLSGGLDLNFAQFCYN